MKQTHHLNKHIYMQVLHVCLCACVLRPHPIRLQRVLATSLIDGVGIRRGAEATSALHSRWYPRRHASTWCSRQQYLASLERLHRSIGPPRSLPCAAAAEVRKQQSQRMGSWSS